MKIVFIGDPLLVSGYRLSGVESIKVTSAAEMIKALEGVYRRADVGIILVDSEYSSQAKEKVEQLKVKYALPVLVEVPGRKGGADIDMKSTISRIMGVKV